MLGAATLVAGPVCRLVNEDNIYRAVFVYAFLGIVVEQRDVPVVLWTAVAGTLVIDAMIAATWGRREQLITATT